MASALDSPTDRKTLLRRIGDTYFKGLVAGDVSGVPYADDIVLRVPLAPGGEECPLIGKGAVLAFFAGVYDAFGATHVKEYYFNDTLSGSVCRPKLNSAQRGKCCAWLMYFTLTSRGA